MRHQGPGLSHARPHGDRVTAGCWPVAAAALLRPGLPALLLLLHPHQAHCSLAPGARLVYACWDGIQSAGTYRTASAQCCSAKHKVPVARCACRAQAKPGCAYCVPWPNVVCCCTVHTYVDV